MAIVFHKIKNLNPKKALSVALLAGLSAMALSYLPVAANGPEFNIFEISYSGGLNRDLPLLDGRNVTRGEGWSASQSDHNAGIQASPGEILEFSVYYHNGAANADENTAINTVIQAFANPSLSGQSFSHTISASIGAQNASTVSSANKGGDMAVQVQGGTAQSLSLVPGSVTLFRDRGLNPIPGPQTMPDTIFTSGVNIGNVRGCFEFHGFVNFRVQVSQVSAPTGNLQIQKQVKNVTQGIPFSDFEVSANPGDTVEYQIFVNALNNQVQNVSIRDAKHPNLSLIGSVSLDNGLIDGNAFFSSGVSIGTVNPGTARTVRFQATVASSTVLGPGTHVLNNTATAISGTQSVSDGADVRVVIQQPAQVACTFTWETPLVPDGSLRGLRKVGDQSRVTMQVTGLPANAVFTIVDQHVSGSPVFTNQQTANSQGGFSTFDTTTIPSSFTPGDYNVFIQLNGSNVAACRGFRIEQPQVLQIAIDKTVRNDNTSTGFVDQVDAAPSHRLTFRLVVSSLTSNTDLQNVNVRDALPSGNKLVFVPGSLLVGGVNRSIDSGSFFGPGINIGSIAPSQQVTITFQVDVASASNFSVGDEFLTNSATASSGTLITSDTAIVKVHKDAPVKQPGAPSPRPL